jgi:speckle-type POZ protein
MAAPAAAPSAAAPAAAVPLPALVAAPARRTSGTTTLSQQPAHEHVWRLTGVTPDFFTGAAPGRHLRSQPFRACRLLWELMLCPNGDQAHRVGGVGLYLRLLSVGAATHRTVRFTLRLGEHTHTSEREFCACASPCGNSTVRVWGSHALVSHAALRRNFRAYAPGDVLALHVTLRLCGAEECTSPTDARTRSPSLAAGWGALLASAEHADVTLACGSERVQAHRLVLCARSPVFAAQLREGPLRVDAAAVPVPPEITPHTLRRLLEFIYTDELEPASPEEASHLLNAADHYGLRRLFSICEHALCSALAADNVATTLTLADQHGAAALKRAALCCAAANAADVLASPGWAHLLAARPSLLTPVLHTMLMGAPPDAAAAALEPPGAPPDVPPPPPEGSADAAAAPAPPAAAPAATAAQHTASTTALVPRPVHEHVWRVEGVTPEFFTAAQPGYELGSPTFTGFGNRTWRLWLYPNGLEEEQHPGEVLLFLELLTPGASAEPVVELRISGAAASKLLHSTRGFSTATPRPEGSAHSVGVTVLTHRELLAAPGAYLPAGALVVTARLRERGYDDCAFDAAPPVDVPPPGLAASWAALLAAGGDADVALVCAADGQAARAHALVLRTRAPLLAALLLRDDARAADAAGAYPVREPADMTAHTLRRLLEFVYTDELEPASPEEAARLLSAAGRYGLRRLFGICERALRAALTVHTAAATLRLAAQHRAFTLKGAALRYALDNLAAVMGTPGWAQLALEQPCVVNEVLHMVATGAPPEPLAWEVQTDDEEQEEEEEGEEAGAGEEREEGGAAAAALAEGDDGDGGGGTARSVRQRTE